MRNWRDWTRTILQIYFWWETSRLQNCSGCWCCWCWNQEEALPCYWGLLYSWSFWFSTWFIPSTSSALGWAIGRWLYFSVRIRCIALGRCFWFYSSRRLRGDRSVMFGFCYCYSYIIATDLIYMFFLGSKRWKSWGSFIRFLLSPIPCVFIFFTLGVYGNLGLPLCCSCFWGYFFDFP